MKNRLLSTLVFCLFHHLSFSCSFAPASFCHTIDLRPDDLIVAGYITSEDSTGINLEIIKVLRGTEDRLNIRIWDGTDFDCNGFFSMAAEDIGNVNDTVVLILPLIDSLENSWDVIGDYLRPDPYFTATSLHLIDGNLEGYLHGISGQPDPLTSFPYEEFIEGFIDEGDCSLILDIEQVADLAQVKFRNPINDRIFLSSTEVISEAELTLIDLQGRVVLRSEIRNSAHWEGNTESLTSGVYFLRVQKPNLPPRVFKLIKT